MLRLAVINHYMYHMGLSQISHYHMSCWSDISCLINRTISLVVWISTSPTSVLRVGAPISSRRICWSRVIGPRSILRKRSRLLLLLRLMLLLLRWFSIWCPLIGSMSMWCIKYRSSRCITVPKSLPNSCLFLWHSLWCIFGLSERSPTLTPIVQHFFNDEGFFYCIMQTPRHQYPYLSTNVEVETKHKLVIL